MLSLSRTEDWARFLERNLKNLDYMDITNSRIDQSIELIRNGYDVNRIQKEIGLGKKEAAIVFELAHSRIKIQDKFVKWNRLWMDQYLASYSTPEIVCRYRSERIRDFDVIEAGSGAGMQSIFLSTTNNSTLSIEIQPERYRMAKLNALQYKTGDLTFVNGDIYKLSSQVEIGPDSLIFSDPARPKTEGERVMSTLIPSPENLVKIFGGKIENFVFDLPPQMKWSSIGIEGEKEYLSINGKLNRLTLYSGRLAKDETSAVLLPQNIRISGKPADVEIDDEIEIKAYLQIPDVSLVYAKLLWKVKENFDSVPVWNDARRYIFTSEDYIPDFPGEQFSILWGGTFDSVHSQLKTLNARKVYLRFPIDDDKYYSFKKSMEDGLEGEIDVYLFKNEDQFYITRKIT